MRNAPAHISAAPAARGVQRCVPFMFNLTPCCLLYTSFVYCQSGGRSAQAARILEQNGFTDVTNLGGIMSYRGPVEM